MKTAIISVSAKTGGVTPQFRVGILLPLALLFVAGAAPRAQAQQYKFQRLNPPRSTYSFAFGLNSNGVVVGSFINSSSAFEGYIYRNGKYETIVFPGSVGFTQASGINDSNVVVGDFTGSDHLTHGFLLTPNGEFAQYDVAPGASTYVFGINNAANFVGFTSFQGQPSVGFVDIGGTVTEFTFMGDYTFASGINSVNDIVGYFFAPLGLIAHGFYRDAAGTMTQVDYPGATETVCLAINDLGEITGYYLDASKVSHGFITKNGKFRTVPFPVAVGINNGGSFVGSYIGKNQEHYGYVAIPVPIDSNVRIQQL